MTDLSAQQNNWNFPTKFITRFLCCYFLLYISASFYFLPFLEFLVNAINELWQTIIPWIASSIFHLKKPITIFSNGSGDTTYDYFFVLVLFLLSVAGAVVWTLVDRKRINYNKLYFWLTLIVCYYLAFYMITYGLAKVFKSQFPFPGPSRLIQPYGHSSPMGLAWTFMGYSKMYNLYTGGAEVLAGVLLLFRKTRMLGSLVTIAVMSNIVAMNFSYDIPVKLFSTHLMLMGVFILAPDIKRLINFFFTNKLIPPPIRWRPVFQRRGRIVATTLKTLFVGYIVFAMVKDSADTMARYAGENPPLYGIYNVETFVVNNDTLAPMQTDTTRWKQLIAGGYKGFPQASVKMMDDSLRRYTFTPDTTNSTVLMHIASDASSTYKFAYSYPDPQHFLLQGKYKEDSVKILFKIIELDKFLLVNRGFHWINEAPYNR